MLYSRKMAFMPIFIVPKSNKLKAVFLTAFLMKKRQCDIGVSRLRKIVVEDIMLFNVVFIKDFDAGINHPW